MEQNEKIYLNMGASEPISESIVTAPDEELLLVAENILKEYRAAFDELAR